MQVRNLLLGLVLLGMNFHNLFAIQSAIFPIPDPPEKSNKQSLGKKLFHDPIFCADRSLSCASCHSLKKGGADNLPTYIGISNQKGKFNTPTVFNASLNFRQFWNAKAKTINEALDYHLVDQTIFANNWDNVTKKLSQESNYSNSFKQIYIDGVTPENIKDALYNYLLSLLTPNSPFDKFLAGDKSALSADAQKGYQLFQQYGCITCHQGPNIGGNLILPLGIYKNYPISNTAILNVKVPSLRNVALTAPYLHDGSINTLKEVVEIMGVYQVGQPIPPYDVPFIVKFLESLTGVLPSEENEAQGRR